MNQGCVINTRFNNAFATIIQFFGTVAAITKADDQEQLKIIHSSIRAGLLNFRHLILKLL
jgi:hypothetical protein